MTDLDQIAQNYRAKKSELDTAQAAFDAAKADFIRAFEDEVGEVGTFDASDGNRYGRTHRAGKITFDFDRLEKENPLVAVDLGHLAFDPTRVEPYLEKYPEMTQYIQGFFSQAEPTVAMLPVVETKEEESEDE